MNIETVGNIVINRSQSRKDTESIIKQKILHKGNFFSSRHSPVVLIAGDGMMKKHNSHDSGYKMLFSNHEMVRQLLTSFVNEEWVL